jgi:hypothetical protein
LVASLESMEAALTMITEARERLMEEANGYRILFDIAFLYGGDGFTLLFFS